MASFDGQNVLITGASSGIGAALAREFAGQGASLVLAARRVERLELVAEQLRRMGAKVAVAACDVTKDEDLRAAVALARAQLGGPLHVAVANAGFGVGGRVEELTVDDYRRQFETNVFGVLRTVYATLDDLTETRGRLAIIGSVNGYLALPGVSAYAMSKFAVRALCESLAIEMRPRGVTVTHIAPGFVASEIRQVDKQGVHHPDVSAAGPKRLEISAERAARDIVRAVRRRRREGVISGHGKLAVWLARHMPWATSGMLSARATMKARRQA